MTLQLQNADIKYIGSGAFRFLFLFIDVNHGKHLVVTSVTLADVLMGDEPSNVAKKLRLMAERLEITS